MDENLSWKYHTSQISIKISRNIGVINRVKYLLSINALLSLYYTMIHPYLLYCNVVWGGASLTALKKLTVLQKRGIRVITYSEYRAPSSPLFKQLRILKLHDIYKLQIYMFMYKAKYSLMPESCSQFVRLNSVASRYDFRTDNEFVIAKYRSEIRKRCISVIGPDLWNSLKDSLKNLSSLSILKSHLIESFVEDY